LFKKPVSEWQQGLKEHVLEEYRVPETQTPGQHNCPLCGTASVKKEKKKKKEI